MKIIEPGHIYQLNTLDECQKEGAPPPEPNILKFVNREPGTEHPGTQTQEVLRALIDRTMHCDNCMRWPGNDLIIYHLRMALVFHEARALERKAEKGYYAPEQMATGHDGHFELTGNKPEPESDAVKYATKLVQHYPREQKQPAFCKNEIKEESDIDRALRIVGDLKSTKGPRLRPKLRRI